ncbi:MAG: hypothetical protein K0S75_1776 [Clostridia bacterium]|jgi:hypothetical protein|nr:hypothetical protein [Clostridia bacterium]
MEKRIYLDIDMDYFVEPIEKESVDNIRLFHDKECEILSVNTVVEKLREQGLNWKNSKISCFTNHKTSYTHWWISKKQDNLLIHIDAHSDLYRNSNKDLRLLHNGDIACYNYIWYGIRDGYIGEVYWVIPDSLKDLLDVQKAENIINKELIAVKFVDEKGMHLQIQCINITGEIKQIPIHICTIDQLPGLEGVCDHVTIATSPEFVPAAADDLVFELIEGFGATKDAAQNIYNQHKNMLKRSPEELQAAWKKLEK